MVLKAWQVDRLTVEYRPFVARFVAGESMDVLHLQKFKPLFKDEASYDAFIREIENEVKVGDLSLLLDGADLVSLLVSPALVAEAIKKRFLGL